MLMGLMDPLTPEQLAEIKELLADADTRPSRLSDWEKGFLNNVKRGLQTYGDKFNPSVKQRGVLRAISEKVYST